VIVISFSNVRTNIPGPKSEKILNDWHKYEADKTGYQARVAIERGSGAMLYDVDGNAFIDWTSGVLVANLGHSPEALVNAIEQAGRNMLNVYEYCTSYRVDAAKALVEAAPDHLDRCFFLTTGSEAVDSAIRIMKRYSGGFEIISFYGSFHGRTLSTASIGGLHKFKRGFGPMLPGAIRVPFPYCYRCPFKSKLETCNLMCLEFLDDVVQANSTDSLAGVVAEPYLGTAGFIFPPKGYMPELEKWIRSKGLIYTLDEVQSSYGRTGEMWALSHEGLTPDIVAVGKGIGSGVSVSAILMRAEVVDKAVSVGELGSTYGGNPLSCAAVSTVLEIMEREKIIDNVNSVSQIFAQRLPSFVEINEHVGDVRGMGLVWGIEFVEDKESKTPAPALVKQLIDLCARKGLLIGGVGMFGNVVRVAPPLVINEAQAHESLDIMYDCIKQLK